MYSEYISKLSIANSKILNKEKLKCRKLVYAVEDKKVLGIRKSNLFSLIHKLIALLFLVIDNVKNFAIYHRYVKKVFRCDTKYKSIVIGVCRCCLTIDVKVRYIV